MKQTIVPARRGFSVAKPRAVLSPEAPFAYDYAPVPRDENPPSEKPATQKPLEHEAQGPKDMVRSPAKVKDQGNTLSVQVRIAVPSQLDSLSKTLGPSIARQLAEKIATAVNDEIATNGCDPSKFAKATASKYSLRCTIGTTQEVTKALQASYGEFGEKALIEITRRMAPQIVAKFFPG